MIKINPPGANGQALYKMGFRGAIEFTIAPISLSYKSKTCGYQSGRQDSNLMTEWLKGMVVTNTVEHKSGCKIDQK